MKYLKLASPILLFAVLIITPIVNADDVSIYYSSELQVGDRFEWETYNYIRDLETNTNSSHSFEIDQMEIVDEFAGVEATPITFYNDFFNVTRNGTQLISIGNYFDYDIFTMNRPYIAPAQTEDGQRFFTHLNENKPNNNWTIDTNFQITEINYIRTSNEVQNISIYYLYETQSGVLLSCEIISELDSNREHVSTIDLVGAPSYVQLEENIQNTGEIGTDEDGNTNAPLFFDLSIYGMISLFCTTIILKRRKITRKT